MGAGSGERPGVAPTSEVEQAVERVTSSSENCGRVHDKTTLAKSDGGIVRGGCLFIGTAGGRRAGALASRASANCASHKRFCGRQRGDVYDDVRAAGGRIRIERERGKLASAARAASRPDAAPARACGGRGEGVLQGTCCTRFGSDSLTLHLVWIAVRARAKVRDDPQARRSADGSAGVRGVQRNPVELLPGAKDRAAVAWIAAHLQRRDCESS